MDFKNYKIGFAISGSFCTLKDVIPEIKNLVKLGANVIPIFSNSIRTIDTRFYKCKDLFKDIEDITGNNILDSIESTEPLGPKNIVDILVVAPCSGNTLSKIAYGINDTPITMAVKSTLRNNKPIVISISTNDGLSASAKNIGYLLDRKNIYFVPFGQDDPINKTNSLVAKNKLILPTIKEAIDHRQIQPILI